MKWASKLKRVGRRYFYQRAVEQKINLNGRFGDFAIGRLDL
jgi:hypothetical protein